MNARQIFAAIPVLFFFLAVTSHAASPQSATLSIISVDLPPLQFYDKNNKLDGYSVDVVKAVLDETPISYDISLYPWARSYNIALKSPNTCIFSMARISEREKLFKWVVPLTLGYMGLYSLEKSDLNIEDINQAKQYVTAVVRDDISHIILKRYGFVEQENLYVVSDKDLLLTLLENKNNIDFISTDNITLKHRAIGINMDFTKIRQNLIFDNTQYEIYLACNNQTNNDIISALRTGFSLIKANGKLAKIYQKWHHKTNGMIAPAPTVKY